MQGNFVITPLYRPSGIFTPVQFVSFHATKYEI